MIQLTGVDTLVLQAGGNLSENYLYTAEAFRDYFDHLTPDGALSITYPHLTRWGVRATAMILKVLHDAGVPEPARHLVVSMSGGYVNLLVKRSPFTEDEVVAIRQRFEQPLHGLLLPLCYELWGQHIPRDVPSLYVFPPEVLAQQRVLYDPFEATPNPYSGLVVSWMRAPDSPELWAQLGDEMAPAYDDRPFFFLPIDADRTFLLRILGLGIPAILFIVGPLLVFRRRGLRTDGAPLMAVYFAGLGLCFIALEVVLLQKFVLFLGHPALSFTVVLATLLVSTGVGSLLSGRIPGGASRVLTVGVAFVAIYGPLLVGMADALGGDLLRAPLLVRILAVSAGTVPLGVGMGFLFPSGIRLLGERAREFVPWAWGINASTSVIGTLLALLLAIKLGFILLALLAVGLYVVSGACALLAAHRLSR
ncbi:MAG TPA: hypothetical protein VKU85_05510 [bacterium]|nr:hypothetical protein [bacterium]